MATSSQSGETDDSISAHDELWEFLETKYDDDTCMIIYEFQSYHEIQYTNNYVYPRDVDMYERNKTKDPTGELEEYAKQLFGMNKPIIDRNLQRNCDSET
jgi:hypothetical protein